jgi:plasmid stability protein
MATLSIKDVPDTWAEALRQRAARNHRSLQGELMALVEKAVIETSPVSGGVPQSERAAGVSAAQVAGLDRFGDPILRRGNKTVEEIATEHRKRFPKPITGGALAVDIVRADRDTR